MKVKKVVVWDWAAQSTVRRRRQSVPGGGDRGAAGEEVYSVLHCRITAAAGWRVS
jgi:hypothetical protein